jgi:hypothetical protein
MSGLRGDGLVRQWREQFQADPLAARAVTGLRGQSAEIWRHTFQLLTQESPEYRNSVDDAFTEESRAHCGELLKTIVSIPAGGPERRGGDPFDFVRTHAEWRARHQVPLIASLHAYRLAHRTYSEISQAALSEHGRPEEVVRSLKTLSNFWLQLFDHVGAVLAEAHAVEEGLIVAQGTPSYAALVDDLLRGRTPAGPEAQSLCGLAGVRPEASLVVAVAAPCGANGAANGGAADLEVTLRSFVRLLERALPPGAFGRLIDVRGGEVALIASRESDAGRELVRALQRGGFVKRASNGHAARVGVSLDVTDIAALPRALDEARTALAFASAEQPMVRFADIDLTDYLIRRADPGALRLAPDWARRVAAAQDAPSRELVRTIRAFADGGLNVKRAAQRLKVHTNTVYFRLNRIQKLSGLNPRAYSGLTALLTAFKLLDAHEGKGPDGAA